MHMRLVQLEVAMGAMPPLRELYANRIIPVLKEVAGCLYAALLQSVQHPDQCISLTLWDSDEDAQAYENKGTFRQLMDEARPYLSSSSEFTIQLSENLTLEYVPIPNKPVVRVFPVADRSDMSGSVHPRRTAMWLRIVSLKVLPGKLGEFKKIYAERTIPALRKVKGCRHVYLLENGEQSHEVLSVTRWDSKEDAEAYEHSGLYEQLLDTHRHTLAGLYQWKRGLGRQRASHSATSEDVIVEQYVVLTGMGSQ